MDYYYCCCSLKQGFFYLVLLHHSGFKSQIAALSLWCVMFLVWRIFVQNLLMLCWYCFYTFLKLYLQFPWPQWILLRQMISWPKSAEIIYLDFYILISFQPPFVLHYYYYYYYYYYITLVLSLNKELNWIELQNLRLQLSERELFIFCHLDDALSILIYNISSILYKIIISP
jgi:hypothetical protein